MALSSQSTRSVGVEDIQIVVMVMTLVMMKCGHDLGHDENLQTKTLREINGSGQGTKRPHGPWLQLFSFNK